MFLHPDHPLMTFLLRKGGCGRLTSSCTSVPSSLHPPKEVGRNEGMGWKGKGGWLEKVFKKRHGRQRCGECLRISSTKLICHQNLITVIYSASFIVLPRQAHPCPTLFCYQNFFPSSHHLFPTAGWYQPLPVQLGRGGE